MAGLKGTRATNKDVDISRGKAKEMLRHGKVHGKPLTKKQKGLFGVIAGGDKPTRAKK